MWSTIIISTSRRLHMRTRRQSKKEAWTTWGFLGSDTGFLDASNLMSRGKDWLSRLARHLENFLQHNLDVSAKSQFDTHQNKGYVSWLCMLVSAILIHPAIGIDSTEVMTAIGKGEPIRGLSLLPVVLFYIKTWKKCRRKDKAGSLFGLLKLLPSLSGHPMTSSIVIQVLQSMVDSKSSLVLQATAIRLLCKTWEASEKVFPYLKVMLDQAYLSGPATYEITLSRAISIYDVCKRDADCGTELVLSIQACIENDNSSIKALGLQSLSLLCQHDVIDFYTAWDVTFELFPEIPSDPLLAESLCQFLQNGALDAAAYPDVANKILKYLWEAATMFDGNNKSDGKWWRVREKALKALASYEVELLEISTTDMHGKHVQILVSALVPQARRACEDLVVKFLLHEYKFRRSGQEEKKPADSKVGKLINAIPRILSSSARKENFAMQFPAVCSLLNPFAPVVVHSDREKNKLQAKNDLKNLQAWVADSEQLFCEISYNLNLSGNLILALLSLQSWSPFIRDWLEATRTINDVLDKSGSLNDTADMHIMKVLFRISDEAIPRVAENAILSLAVLYQVSQLKPDTLLDLVKYLESHLLCDGHEYLQWTSAIALGIVAQHLNGTEWRLKLDMARSLIQCLHNTDRDIVRGACSMALGFLCQNLINREDSESVTDMIGMIKEREMSILALILEHTVNLLCQFCPEMADSLQKIGSSEFEIPGQKLEIPSSKVKGNFQRDGECIWTVAGLAMALGSSVIAIERAGIPALVGFITELLIQGIPTSHSKLNLDSYFSLAIGSFISLPTCLEACFRLELLRDKVNALLQQLKDFVYWCKEIRSVPALLVFAACIGSGNVLATILYHGTHGVPLKDIHELVESMKTLSGEHSCATSSLGGMMGLANSLGAGAAVIAPPRRHRIHIQGTLSTIGEESGESPICNPLLYERRCTELVQNMIQCLLGHALQESDASMRSGSAWALMLIRKSFTEDNNIGQNSNANYSTKDLMSLPKNSTLYLLCSWILNLGKKQENSTFPYGTAISILRCLEKAPRLPKLDWGTLMRQLMHQMLPLLQEVYGAAADTRVHHVNEQDAVCEDYLLFLLAHAKNIPILQSLLSELCELSQLISLGPSLSSLFMLHMADLNSIFSEPRMERFFVDTVELTNRAFKLQGSECFMPKKICWKLSMSFWKGFRCLITKFSKESNDRSCTKQHNYFRCAEKCLEILHDGPSMYNQISGNQSSVSDGQLLYEVWSAALECISQASKEWISKITEFDWKQPPTTEEDAKSACRAIFIISQMVARGCLAPSVLLNPVRCLCNQEISPKPATLMLCAKEEL